MSLPPINLLLPQRFTFKDEFTDFPLHISSPSPAPLLTFLLLDRIHKVDEQEESSHTILLNCHGGKQAFTESLIDGTATSHFYLSEASSKGKYLAASTNLDMIHITHLHELRAVLYTLIESVDDDDDLARHKIDDVPDSQASSDGCAKLPILAITGMDIMHHSVGEASAQSMSRTLAALIDLSRSFNIVIHDSQPLSTEIDVCSGTVPRGFEDQKTTLEALYRRYISCEWHVPGVEKEGIWRYLGTKIGYKVQWDEDLNGECRDIKVVRLSL